MPRKLIDSVEVERFGSTEPPSVMPRQDWGLLWQYARFPAGWPKLDGARKVTPLKHDGEPKTAPAPELDGEPGEEDMEDEWLEEGPRDLEDWLED